MKIDVSKLPAIIERLTAGTSSLGAEAKALGMSYRTTLIGTLRQHMGREKYDAMIAGKKAITTGVPSGTGPRPDDAGIPIVSSMGKSHGWSWRHVTEHDPRVVRVPLKGEGTLEVLDGGNHILISQSPDGVEYVEAQPDEKADLLRTHPWSKNGAPMRFIRWELSRLYARVHKRQAAERALVEQGLEAKAAKKAAKVEAAEAALRPTAKLPAVTKRKSARGKGRPGTAPKHAPGRASKQGPGTPRKTHGKAL